MKATTKTRSTTREGKKGKGIEEAGENVDRISAAHVQEEEEAGQTRRKGQHNAAPGGRRRSSA
jgi:hypothetical protein